jgi:hypothetical protein
MTTPAMSLSLDTQFPLFGHVAADKPVLTDLIVDDSSFRIKGNGTGVPQVTEVVYVSRGV